MAIYQLVKDYILGHLLPAAARALPLALAPAWLCAQQANDAAAAPMAMQGLYGSYPLTREGSGTSWEPDSTPMQGAHQMYGQWMTMEHGFINGIYDDQGGPRGDTQTFSTSMLMLMARRELSDGAFGARVMISGDPLMGDSGYPLLFQTGETANGVDPLIDRQHPHDLLMEAALTYSHDFAPGTSAFVYAGLPGEPALGPNAFMHRLSAMDNPEAPLSHHWLDSTHVSWGVLTGGYVVGNFKLEASAFNGREPDQNRYNIEIRPLDSYSVRAAYNPSAQWSLQGSFGRLASPEQLEPAVSMQRSTASVSYNAPIARWWQTTFAFGHNAPSQGNASDAWLLESAAAVTPALTLFARYEHVAKDELFVPGQSLYGRSFTIQKVSVGYVYDFAHLAGIRLGLGALLSGYDFPSSLNATYSARPTSFMVFVRARL
jgi:hypothetical protein